MTIINPNSISGISSITALNSTAAINLFKADGTAANIIAGVTTGTNFKTGSSNLHNVGIEIAGINVLGADTPIGAGATIYNSGAALFTGTVTAPSLDISGDIDVDGHTNLDNVSIAGVTTTTGDLTVGSGGENSALGVRFNSAYAQIKLPDGQTGANRKGNLSFGDNDDFRILHDGHHNYITAGTGDIFVSTSSANPVNIRNSRVDLNVDLTLTDTATDSAAGPEFKLFRNSASPADADYLGQIKFAGESDTGVERNYAKITGKILDASNGTEDGILEFAHIKAGSQTITGRWRSDSLQLLNGTNLSVNGTATFESTVTLSGGNLVLGDSGSTSDDRIVLGADSDLMIYHNGSDSVIREQGTGNLDIQTTGGNVDILVNTTEHAAKFISNGAVELYYNNIKNCETNSAGISLFGQENGDCVLDMNADEGDDYTDKWRLNVTQGGSFQLKNFADGSWENHIQTTVNSSVELYHNGTKKFETTTNGSRLYGAQQDLHGDVKFDNQANSGMDLRWDESLNRLHFEQDNIKAVFGTSSDFEIYHDPNYNILKGINAQSTQFWTNNVARWRIQASGHLMPEADNNYDVGTSTYRVRNIYTADIHCSNRGSSNDVDGTWGDYTIQEGESDLFLINNRSGKKYKFNLTEVS